MKSPFDAPRRRRPRPGRSGDECSRSMSESLSGRCRRRSSRATVGTATRRRTGGETEMGARDVQRVVDVAEDRRRRARRRARSAERGHRLRVDVGQQDPRALPPAPAHHVARARACPVESIAGTWRMRMISTFGLAARLGERVLELLRRAEEERAVDLVDLDARRHRAAVDARSGSSVARRRSSSQLARDRADVGDLRHAPHEQERREHHADLDRDGEVDEHREHERRRAARRRRSCGARSSARKVRHSLMW